MTRLGKRGWYSSFGPRLCTGALSTLSTRSTACGAHGHGGQLNGLTVHLHRVAERLGVGLEEDLLEDQARRPMSTVTLPSGRRLSSMMPLFGFDADLLLHGQALVHHEAGEAARAVAALLHFEPSELKMR